MQTELARDRQRTMLAVAAAQRDGQRAMRHGRTLRRAERAERRYLNRVDEAKRLRAMLNKIEA
ncbi:MAG TPA: hypothetical protein VEV61_16045, partial [Streptosporangiaceae bacterium]|nr:hypothetical protein [Streptosporangiaceae bacterium]